MFDAQAAPVECPCCGSTRVGVMDGRFEGVLYTCRACGELFDDDDLSTRYDGMGRNRTRLDDDA